jgi:hypothetical protein
VFTICNVASGVQVMCALDAMTGALHWSYAVPGATTYPETPPVVADGAVYFGACGTSCAYVGLHEHTGTLLWTQSQPAGCEVNNGTVPAVSGGSVYASTGCPMRRLSRWTARPACSSVDVGPGRLRSRERETQRRALLEAKCARSYGYATGPSRHGTSCDFSTYKKSRRLRSRPLVPVGVN